MCKRSAVDDAAQLTRDASAGFCPALPRTQLTSIRFQHLQCGSKHGCGKKKSVHFFTPSKFKKTTIVKWHANCYACEHAVSLAKRKAKAKTKAANGGFKYVHCRARIASKSASLQALCSNYMSSLCTHANTIGTGGAMRPATCQLSAAFASNAR